MKIFNELILHPPTFAARDLFTNEYSVKLYNNGAQEWRSKDIKKCKNCGIFIEKDYLMNDTDNWFCDQKNVPHKFEKQLVCIIYNTGDAVRFDIDGKVIAIETHDGIFWSTKET